MEVMPLSFGRQYTKHILKSAQVILESYWCLLLKDDPWGREMGRKLEHITVKLVLQLYELSGP